MDNKHQKDEYFDIEGEDFFDDCPMCQVLKKARDENREPTLEEIKEVMKNTKENGGIVGGEFFKED